MTRSFANPGAVLRRSTYLQLRGFESRFFHMYEEPDYALQCVDFQIFWSEISIPADATEIPPWLPHFYFDPIKLRRFDAEFDWLDLT